jgi:hypothetical protein
MDVAAIEAAARRTGGATWEISTDRPYQGAGFAVAALSGTAIVARDLRDGVGRFLDLCGDRAPYLGVWWDSEEGAWAVDPVLVFGDRDDALREAARLGQKAIFEFAAGEEIVVGRAHDRAA